jgi:hypothetical protein
MVCDLFECICIVFIKYRASTCLDKCSFFMQRLKYVFRGIMDEENIPVSSKYDMVQDWKLPETAKMVFSLVSICNLSRRSSEGATSHGQDVLEESNPPTGRDLTMSHPVYGHEGSYHEFAYATATPLNIC